MRKKYRIDGRESTRDFIPKKVSAKPDFIK